MDLQNNSTGTFFMIHFLKSFEGIHDKIWINGFAKPKDIFTIILFNSQNPGHNTTPLSQLFVHGSAMFIEIPASL
jgi:hypothetical protein